jgi:predicted DNA-binding antitoxin AbrB/MazE fold protein
MTKVIEAIYSHGVLEPLEALQLAEKQRVRLTIEPINGELTEDQARAMDELMQRLQRSTLSFGGPYPSRDELHER